VYGPLTVFSGYVFYQPDAVFVPYLLLPFLKRLLIRTIFVKKRKGNGGNSPCRTGNPYLSLPMILRIDKFEE
jgi:hypothetical protein